MLEKGHMGMSNMWFYQQLDSPQAWPETPWALPLAEGDFPELKASKSTLGNKPFFKGEWFWESGFDKHPVDDLELVRDWNLRALFGAFTALKTGAKRDEHTHAALKWVSHVGGPRESRLLEGDVLLTQDDIVANREFPDGFIATTWDNSPKTRLSPGRNLAAMWTAKTVTRCRTAAFTPKTCPTFSWPDAT
jgi:hypothetical protein